MTTPPKPNGVTLMEAAPVLSTLERRPIAPSQIRSMLVLDTTSRALEPRRRGDTRLFSAYDLAAVRLILRLRRQGVSPTVARVVVANLRETLERHWPHRDPMAVAVIGFRGLVVPVTTPRTEAVVAWVETDAVWRGVEDHVRAVRATVPEVTRWNQPITMAQRA